MPRQGKINSDPPDNHSDAIEVFDWKRGNCCGFTRCWPQTGGTCRA